MSEKTSGDAPTKVEEVRDQRATPHEHAYATGHVKPVPRNVTLESPVNYYSWQHTAAAQLHGWADHEHHEAAPIRVTRREYEDALKAASEPVTRLADNDGKPTGAPLSAEQLKKLNSSKPLVTDYEPHTPALSKHCAHAKDR